MVRCRPFRLQRFAVPRSSIVLVLAYLSVLVSGAASSPTSLTEIENDDNEGKQQRRLSRRGRRRAEEGEAGGRKNPNIILLLTDDQDVLLGGMDAMPHLHELLVEGGTLFRNGFVHTPTCCPSRSSILSGRYVHNGVAVTNQLEGNCYGSEWIHGAEKDTFAVYAKEAGYVTSYAGKYLNQYGQPGSEGCITDVDSDVEVREEGCRRIPPGWDYWWGHVANLRDDHGHGYYYNYRSVVSDDGGATPSRERRHGFDYATDYLPDAVANRTLSILDHLTSTPPESRRPFLLVNAWPTPHGPSTPAPWAELLHDGARAPRTPNYNASDQYMATKHWLLRNLAPMSYQTADIADKLYEHRLESLHSVDSHIAQIVGLLKDRGELGNTVIFYMSDNGFQLGQHRLAWGKGHLYEHDIRVPFIVSGLGTPKGVISDRPVVNVDVAPTIYELVTGTFGSLPPNMDGISFAPYLRSGQWPTPANNRQDFLVSYRGMGDPTCGLPRCPPPQRFLGTDALNNTYHCIRSIHPSQESTVGGEDGVGARDDIYCRFDDDEHFGEYYDHILDPMQLINRYHDLPDMERANFERRLDELKRCKGGTCRTLPSDAAFG